MTRLALPAAVMLLAACSSEPDQGRADPANGSGEAVAEPSPTPGYSPLPAIEEKTGSGLRANISALAGDVSGLNTRISDMGLVIDLPADALFEFDEATLTPEAEAQLRKALTVIRQSPPGALRVVGHTDDRGDDAYNQRLSNRRAESVAEWLKQRVGVRTRAIEVSGKGETEPIAPNSGFDGSDSPAGRAKNRRVEIIIPREGG